MTASQADNPYEKPVDAPHAQEGTYDAQLLFPSLIGAPPEAFTSIIKRDGRQAPFEKAKIASAIIRAMESVGQIDRDRAESLASGVALYLSKSLRVQTPSVDQVNDAVERVLIELGHGDIALVYARYRDKRARIRELREGNMKPLLYELAEARRGRLESETASPASMFVRTSGDTLAAWDTHKIVEALMRETGMDEDRARLVALEVEQQILSSEVKTLTASLVRELVDAKLIEHGLEEFRLRHMRLGVPLFDAEQIICVPNRDESSYPRDPLATDLELAERVKREFALTRVYGREEADAHMLGDIHLHDLGFIDRFQACSASLAYVTRFGMPAPGHPRHARPPRNAETFLSHLGRFSAAIRPHFMGAVRWDALNSHLAPYAAGLSEDALRQFVRLALIGLAYRSPAPRYPVTPGVVHIAWEGPPGAEGERSLARRVALALFDVCTEERFSRGDAVDPVLCVHFDAADPSRPLPSEWLERAAAYAASGGAMMVAFEREDTDSLNGEPPREAWQLRGVWANQVTLNLPRAAYRGGGEEGVRTELAHLARLAAQAHTAKRAFLERLFMAKSFGPSSFLSAEHQGTPLLELDDVCYAIGIAGLNECVQMLSGRQMHESEEAFELGLRLASYVREQGVCLSEEFGLHFEAVPVCDSEVCARFAALDIRAFRDPARGVIKSNPITHDLYYTPGVEYASKARQSSAGYIHMMGRFHSIFPMAPPAAIRLSEEDSTPAMAASLIHEAARQSQIRRLVFEAGA